ncbi:MAG: hypothetical protein QW390_01580, partial [Candidatus Bathyarchaeia archaeon]
FSPGPKCLTFTPSQTISVASSIRRSGGKSVTLTPSMADEMANMSRYPIAEATPPFYSQDFGGPLGDILFGAPPYAVNTLHNKSHGPLLTYKLVKARSAKTPERTSAERVPGRINRAPSSIVKTFLRSVFSKNGAMESNAVSLIARSRGLAEDYQDLLLRMGITSRIMRLGAGDFKVFIPSDSLKPFIKCLIGTGKSRLYPYPRSRSKAASDTDLLPADIGFKAVTLLRNLGLRETRVYAGLSGDSVSKGCVSKLIKAADQRLIELSRGLLEKTDIRSIRRLLRWSRGEAARRIGLSIEAIDNAERSRYSPGQSQVILEKLRRAASDLVQQASLEVRRLKDLSQGSIKWLRVEKVRRLPNKGPLRTRWVYDLTVEPTHNFVSHGLILHNTVSVAKGGIVATLNARASILAAANPALGRYDPYRLIADNINLPVTILSRFDLIFLMKDLPDPERDAKTSDHILELHKVKRAPDEPPLSPELLRKYIAYGRRLETVLTDETVRKLKEFYLKMRSLSTTSPGSPIAITPRQLEALVRLSEARAKTFLRDKVLPEDANAVITLMTLSLQDVGMDTSTGKIDIDVIMTGKSKSLRDMMQLIRSTLADLEEDGGAVEEPKLYDELRKIGLKDEDIKKGLTQLIKEGLIYSPRTGYLKRTTG